MKIQTSIIFQNLNLFHQDNFRINIDSLITFFQGKVDRAIKGYTTFGKENKPFTHNSLTFVSFSSAIDIHKKKTKYVNPPIREKCIRYFKFYIIIFSFLFVFFSEKFFSVNQLK